MKKINIVYDLELNPNIFIFVGKEVESKIFRVFEISKRKDDRYKLVEYLKNIETMIGFNNVRFDYPILHILIKTLKIRFSGNALVKILYEKGQELIKQKNMWDNAIKKSYVNQIDLFLINHYDNYAKSTSLKILQFNMNMKIVKTLPYAFDKYLTDEEIDETIIYCKNDVEATYMFYLYNLEKIVFRKRFSKDYNMDFTNYNDVKIGGEILLDELTKGMDSSKYVIRKMRTFRKAMNMDDIIFDYVKFDGIELQTLLEWWKDKVIFETKGQFTKLDMKDVKPLLPYCNNETVKGKLKNLNIIVDKFQFDFGTGGLHGACHPGVFRADENNDLLLIDVSSYYPNLAYYNKLHPKHIPVEIFGKVIKTLYDRRMDARADRDNETVAAIKLALNGYLYGNSNMEHSFIYDPQFMMQICVNGQLLLTMLAERIIKIGIKIIQVNTDGIMVLCPKSMRDTLDLLVKQWANLTKLKLDYDHFEFVVQKDVNNYMARYTNTNMKYKGVFDFKYTENGDWHKNFSALIVPRALNAYFTYKLDPHDFILKHKDSMNFFLRTKYNKLTRLVEREYDEKGNLMSQRLLQNVTRYFVSKTGKEFIKIMKPLKGQDKDREFKVESGWLCKESNNSNVIDFNDINFDYYIGKVQEIINTVEDYIALEDLPFKIIDDTNIKIN